MSTKLVCTLTSTRVMGGLVAAVWGTFVWGALVWGEFVRGGFVRGGFVWGGFDLLTAICFVGLFWLVLPRLLDDLGTGFVCFLL